MRRSLLLLYVSLAMLLLCGCGATLAADRHDVERLLLIQTMGLDASEGGVEMSVSSGLGADGEPALVMAAAGRGIEDAIARLQNYSPENQLFYAHVQYLLLGEQAARTELQNVIEWVDRSPTLRMDTDVLVVRGLARDAVTGTSRDDTDITQRLASLDRQARSAGWTIHTLREVAAALAQGEGALALAMDTVPTEGKVFTAGQLSDAVAPAGYAALGRDGLVEFLTPEQSLGAELLTRDPTGLLITVEDCTMAVLEGSAQIEGRPLEGIDVRCTLRTGVLEKLGSDRLSPEALDAALSETAAAWVSGALQRAQDCRCDFLALRQAVLKRPEDLAAYGDRWGDVLAKTPVTVTVSGRVDRSYDLAE